jgi:hypothetical protein
MEKNGEERGVSGVYPHQFCKRLESIERAWVAASFVLEKIGKSWEEGAPGHRAVTYHTNIVILGPIPRQVPINGHRTSPGPSVPPVVGLRSSVIEMYAPIHDPEAAKQTYIQFFV